LDGAIEARIGVAFDGDAEISVEAQLAGLEFNRSGHGEQMVCCIGDIHRGLLSKNCRRGEKEEHRQIEKYSPDQRFTAFAHQNFFEECSSASLLASQLVRDPFPTVSARRWISATSSRSSEGSVPDAAVTLSNLGASLGEECFRPDTIGTSRKKPHWSIRGARGNLYGTAPGLKDLVSFGVYFLKGSRPAVAGAGKQQVKDSA
jgi:hypothetical protein